MKILNKIETNSLQSSCVTIGKFDGPHLGHQILLNNVIEKSRITKGPSVVVTFEPLPKEYFTKDDYEGRMFNIESLSWSLEKFGIDFLILLSFDETLSQMDPSIFLNNIIFQGLNPNYLTVGTDFNFGKSRSGDVKMLERFASEKNIELEICRKMTFSAEDISSTRIKKLLVEGELSEANRLLGFNFFHKGKVLSGDKRGRKIGFPTANLALKDGYILPNGVYKTRTLWAENGPGYTSVTNVGYHPTFGKSESKLLETHIIDQEFDLYGKNIRVEFMAYLRPEIKFESANELKEQISKDITLAKREVNE